MNIAADTDAHPRRRTAPRAQRRQQLIDAAMEAIAEYGLARTTTAEVARRAGLSVGLINHHFESKDKLFTSTLQYLAEDVRSHWVQFETNDQLNAAEKLIAVIDGMFHPDVCTPTKIAVWFAFFGDARYRAVYRELVDSFDNERDLAIEALCTTLKTEGDYAEVNPSALAESIEALADGLWLSLMLYPEWASADDLKHRVYDLVATKFPRHFSQAAPEVVLQVAPQVVPEGIPQGFPKAAAPGGSGEGS